MRKELLTRRLAKAIERLALEGVAFKHVGIGNLPLYNQEDDAARRRRRQRQVPAIVHGSLHRVGEALRERELIAASEVSFGLGGAALTVSRRVSSGL